MPAARQGRPLKQACLDHVLTRLGLCSLLAPSAPASGAPEPCPMRLSSLMELVLMRLPDPTSALPRPPPAKPSRGGAAPSEGWDSSP